MAQSIDRLVQQICWCRGIRFYKSTTGSKCRLQVEGVVGQGARLKSLHSIDDEGEGIEVRGGRSTDE